MENMKTRTLQLTHADRCDYKTRYITKEQKELVFLIYSNATPPPPACGALSGRKGRRPTINHGAGCPLVVINITNTCIWKTTLRTLLDRHVLPILVAFLKNTNMTTWTSLNNHLVTSSVCNMRRKRTRVGLVVVHVLY